MPQPVFEFSDPATWLPAIAAGGAGLYALSRVFRRDSRNDNQEKLIDEGVQQIITSLREEVARLTGRVASMEEELVRLHEERAIFQRERAEFVREKAELVAKLDQCNSKCGQPALL